MRRAEKLSVTDDDSGIKFCFTIELTPRNLCAWIYLEKNKTLFQIKFSYRVLYKEYLLFRVQIVLYKLLDLLKNRFLR